MIVCWSSVQFYAFAFIFPFPCVRIQFVTKELSTFEFRKVCNPEEENQAVGGGKFRRREDNK
ncbi:hypothetical protein LEP1GSC016_3935 [Leptospira borgpetersenii serovar Hardjo-bovis str. Sponselee]|uniref:Uncharacterized protein n=7 Tax=Leptospira borgpetersenii TaxID=174 RepID=M3GDI9_LEPBO|nr:hypothetical protein LBBP_01042 [Leptospira borgpetersenii serovar Ballum]EKP13833.1 hypothetical protein LEP1GSC128_0686 [Leptospira borgpetersenii str. 200801926]EKQ92909.1 hypothetical protein LEP1GSC101_3750 [Leptospira borgpetersenii str. UI 09149]EKQ98649.1 hypothetical protein LEP1GSC121_3238 [Leptospira borgpetersenii serovar Castellonis str. 200801910]EMF99006.1 hypothetical protein LEP1GSC123_3468 [Leptospira borgpetersenii str. 200701203]EMJ77537.1 hypothetical protein LEP1GSC016